MTIEESYSKLSTSDENRKINDVASHTVVANKEENDEEMEKHISSLSLETNVDVERGTVQRPEYRDKYFAIAFVAHFLVIIVGAFALAPNTIRTAADEQDDIVYNENNGEVPPINATFFLILIFFSWIVSSICTYASLEIIKNNAQKLIQLCLILNVAYCSIISVKFLLLAISAEPEPDADMYLQHFIVFLILAIFFAIYSMVVWNNIPFAASNMKCGVVAIKKNLGVAGFSFVSPLLLLICYLLQMVALIGFFDVAGVYDKDEYGGNAKGNAAAIIISIFITLSFYWTTQVIKNISVVTVSGTVGTWWFSPNQADSVCSTAVTDSFHRAITFSFGSICFGSLVVAIIEMLLNFLRKLQRDRGCALFYCIIACLLSYVEMLAEYFNKWAFVYVGLYGYGYVEAGKKVITLFKARGWTSIVANTLVSRCLSMISVTVAIVSGSLAAVIGSLGGVGSGHVSQDMLIGFFTGFLIGIFNASSIFTVLESAVNTIVVCFAEAPSEFENNHPDHSRELHETWSSTWPNISLRGQMV